MEELYSNIQDLLQLEEADVDENDEAAPEQEAEILENKIEEENIQTPLKLDFKLKTCAERADLVNRIVAQTPQENLTNRYLEIMGDYIMGGISKEEKKERLYVTDNRRITIDRRETSFEGLAEKFENGEDGIYNLITNDKNIIFQHKQQITEEDIKTIPGLKELRDNIKEIEEAGKHATGRKKYLLKKQLIEMRRDQYVLKNSYKAPIYVGTSAKGINKIDLSETKYIDKDGKPQSTGLISFFNQDHISAILCHYNALKLETRGRYQDDFYYLMEDFDKLLYSTLEKDYPAYLEIVKMKIDNKSNLEIQEMLQKNFNISHSIQYISSLWRNKIPKLIAEKAQNDYLIWHYTTIKKDALKRCACCGELKPANNRFFSKNKTAKDGWYSWCKKCRNAKNKGEI